MIQKTYLFEIKYLKKNMYINNWIFSNIYLSASGKYNKIERKIT